MSRPLRSVVVVVALLTATVGLVRPAHATAAGRFHGGHVGGHGFGHGGGHGFGHGRRFHSFFGFAVAPPVAVVPFVSGSAIFDPPPVVYAPPPVVYAPPPVSYAPPVMSAPPAYAPPPVAAAPQPPPMPRVVEYPGGRYELRGDGIGTPHTWVWIPNPPSGPPPSESSASSASRRNDGASRAERVRSRAYRWVDDDGVVNWTNDPETIPERYRPQRRAADGSRL